MASASGQFSASTGQAGLSGKLVRGHVVWLTLPQTLATRAQFAEQEAKTRPCLVLDREVSYITDSASRLVSPARFMGVDGTSKSYLVEGRPDLELSLPGARRTITHVFFDSIRTIEVPEGTVIEPVYQLSPAEKQAMLEGLARVLQPEPHFFLKALLRRSVMPGQIWHIDTPALQVTGMVLLRRWSFVVFDDEDAHDPTDTDGGRLKQVPYLVALFPPGHQGRTLQGLTWADLRIAAIPERAFVEKVGQYTDSTVSIMLNNLRRFVGVEAVPYATPALRHQASLFLDILRAFSGFRGPGLS